MPKAAIGPVAQLRAAVILAVPVKGGDDSNHLIVPEPHFLLKLIVTDAGVGLARLHDAVQNILTIVPLI